MLPSWDIISIAFLGGILFLKRFRGGTAASDLFQWRVPLSPPTSPPAPEENKAELSPKTEIETEPPQTEESQPLPASSAVSSQTMPAAVTTGGEVLGGIHETPALNSGFAEVNEPLPAPPTALSWINEELVLEADAPRPEPARRVSKTGTDAGLPALNFPDPEPVAAVPILATEAMAPAEPIVPSIAEASAPSSVSPADLALEEQIRLLEQQVAAGDQELKNLGGGLDLPTLVVTTPKPESKKKRKMRVPTQKSRELTPLVSLINPETPRPEPPVPLAGNPVAGISGDFSAEQVLGLVKRLWENRDSERPEVRQQVEEFLPRVVPSLMKVAESASVPESVRYDAVLLLGNVRAQDSVELLARLAGDPLPAVRYASATALAGFSADQAVTPLLAALNDGHYLVRSTAAQSLGKLHPMPALPALVKSLADSSRMVRVSAREAVQSYPVDELCARLPFILPRSPAPSIHRALKVLAALPGDRKIEAFRDLLKSNHPRVFPRVWKTVFKMGDSRLADDLADAIHRLDPPLPVLVLPHLPREDSSRTGFPSSLVVTAPPQIATSENQESTINQIPEPECVPVGPQHSYGWLSEVVNHDLSRTRKFVEPPHAQQVFTTPVVEVQQAESVAVPPAVEQPRTESESPANGATPGNGGPAMTSSHGSGNDTGVETSDTPGRGDSPAAETDLASFREIFQKTTAFDQVRLFRHFLETNQSLKCEDLSGLYGSAASPFIKAGILDALTKFGPVAEPFLILCLLEKEEETLLAAIKALAEVGGVQTVESLRSCRRHPNKHVRFSTEIALEKIRSRKGKA